MNDLEAKVRCLELAEKIQIKVGERHVENILATSEKLWQHVSQSEPESPSELVEKGTKKPPGRPRKSQGEPDPLS